jgi:hypothetical protein
LLLIFEVAIGNVIDVLFEYLIYIIEWGVLQLWQVYPLYVSPVDLM